MTDEIRPTILVVDDERLNRTILGELLHTEYRVLLATDGHSALEQALRHATEIELILLDVSMPGMSGYDVLARLKREESTSHISVVFVTARNDDENEERGLGLGAVDYIHKPIRPAIVAARIRNLVEQARQNKALELLAHQDGLTGIANRRHFDEAFGRACRHARRTGVPLGIALIDIDHFKLFNDLYGHLHGDEALRRVARALAGRMRRPYDLAARFGGEEFALLAQGGQGFPELVEAFREDVEGLRIEHAASPTGPYLTVSSGALLIEAGSALLGLAGLGYTDKLLYEAKTVGRNRVVFAHSPKFVASR